MFVQRRNAIDANVIQKLSQDCVYIFWRKYEQNEKCSIETIDVCL